MRVRVACTELNLRPATRGLAVIIASYFSRDGEWSLPLSELLATTGLKRAAFLAHLRTLREVGIIEGGGCKGHSRYRIGARLRTGSVQELGPAQSKNLDRTYVSAVRSQDPEGDLSTGGREIARVPKPPPVRAALATERQIRRYVVARDQGLPRDEWLPDWHRPEELRSWTRRAVSELITRVETREATLKAGMTRVERHIAQERRDVAKALATIPIPADILAKFDPQPEPITAPIPTCRGCRQTNPTGARRGRCDRCRKLTVSEAKLLRRANCLAADRRAA